MFFSGVIATNRFGLGASKGELEQANKDPLKWLHQKLVPIYFNQNLPSSEDVLTVIQEYNKEKKQLKKKKQVAPKFTYPAQTYIDFVSDGLQQAIVSEHSVSWRLLDFFSNHFSVSTNGRMLRALAPTLEREAIAPNLLGHFSDMLLDVVKHPAMLVYLNNDRSYGPNSRIGIKRKKGMNENLAREILELHTLGVNGGYQQQDVVGLAKGITGWSIANKRDSKMGFVYRDKAHEPGTHNLLGKSYSQKGIKQGEAMLKSLANHPSTARYICYKLAHHFISDQPDKALVESLVEAWTSSKGHIKTVMYRLFEHEASWSTERLKFKTPREYLISVYRGLGEEVTRPKKWVNVLTQLGQKSFNAGSPAGFSDDKEDWNGASALMARIDWINTLVRKHPYNAENIMQQTLGKSVSERTYNMVMRAESRQQALALLLLSPEFLRR